MQGSPFGEYSGAEPGLPPRETSFEKGGGKKQKRAREIPACLVPRMGPSADPADKPRGHKVRRYLNNQLDFGFAKVFFLFTLFFLLFFFLIFLQSSRYGVNHRHLATPLRVRGHGDSEPAAKLGLRLELFPSSLGPRYECRERTSTSICHSCLQL